VVLFKPFQDADVGQAERAASFQSNTDARARFRSGLLGWGRLSERLRGGGILLREADSAEE
jgi:hypothetical protein